MKLFSVSKKSLLCSFRVIHKCGPNSCESVSFWSSGFLWASSLGTGGMVVRLLQTCSVPGPPGTGVPGLKHYLSAGWESLETHHLLVYPPCPRAKLFNFALWKLKGKGKALQDLHRAGLCWWDKLERRLKEAAPFIRVHWPRFWLCFFIRCSRNRLGKWLLVTFKYTGAIVN